MSDVFAVVIRLQAWLPNNDLLFKKLNADNLTEEKHKIAPIQIPVSHF